jgi:hypothetical protein
VNVRRQEEDFHVAYTIPRRKLRHLAERGFAAKPGSKLPESNLHISDKDHPKVRSLALMEPEDSVHGA